MRYIKTMMAFAALAATVTLASCDYDEDELTPSDETSSYQLPQGSHDYDATETERAMPKASLTTFHFPYTVFFPL